MKVNYRPGPARLEPGCAPNGWVFQIYAVPANRSPNARLLMERALTTNEAGTEGILGERDAEDAVAMLRPDEEGICIVTYDGDTGERLDGAAITEIINQGEDNP